MLFTYNVLKIKGSAHKNGDIDSTCKRSLSISDKFGVFETRFSTMRVSIYLQAAKRASAAAAPLAAWTTANIKYSYILEKIEPLEAEQNALKK